jgi:hypothetical protein
LQVSYFPIGNAFYRVSSSCASSKSFKEMIPVNLEEDNFTRAFPFTYPVTVP